MSQSVAEWHQRHGTGPPVPGSSGRTALRGQSTAVREKGWVWQSREYAEQQPPWTAEYS